LQAAAVCMHSAMPVSLLLLMRLHTVHSSGVALLLC
jgi:hypothetical protein